MNPQPPDPYRLLAEPRGVRGKYFLISRGFFTCHSIRVYPVFCECGNQDGNKSSTCRSAGPRKLLKNWRRFCGDIVLPPNDTPLSSRRSQPDVRPRCLRSTDRRTRRWFRPAPLRLDNEFITLAAQPEFATECHEIFELK